ncbi:MAG: succinate dehydrogenase assembly factor 2 [Anaerolineae bacterium]|jgi:antitoxin CptB
MSGTEDDALRLQRLRWQCRRGMLELDLLLNNFLDQAWSDLDDARRHTLERLLAVEDQVLIDWLLGDAIPAERAVREITDQIRSTTRPI